MDGPPGEPPATGGAGGSGNGEPPLGREPAPRAGESAAGGQQPEGAQSGAAAPAGPGPVGEEGGADAQRQLVGPLGAAAPADPDHPVAGGGRVPRPAGAESSGSREDFRRLGDVARGAWARAGEIGRAHV